MENKKLMDKFGVGYSAKNLAAIKNRNDNMNWKKCAEKSVKEKIGAVRHYIGEGIDRKKALEMIFENCSLGAGYRAQIEYETKI